MIIKYLKELSNKLFAKFSLITVICGFIAFYYSKYDPSNIVAEFVVSNFLYVFVLFLTISSYQVWKEAKLDFKKKQLELDEIKRNPVDYKITAKLKKLFIDLDKIKKGYKTKEEIKELLEDCNQPSNLWSSLISESDDFHRGYSDRLNIYKDELKGYLSRSQENFSQWSVFCHLDNIYIVDFYIESIGNKSDKNIDVEIQLENNSYIENLSKLENYPDFLEVPKKPNFMDGFDINPAISNIHDLNRPLYNKNAYYKFKEFNEKSLFINLREMNVGDNISIFKEKVLIELPKKEEIKVIIKSENSNAKIEKAVEFETEENPIEYFDYLMSQE